MTLEEGLALYPSSTILLLTTGEVHSQSGDMTKSIKLFQRVAELDPFHPLGFLNAARTYQQLGELHTALTHIQRAALLDPALAMTRIDLAQLLRQMGEIDRASEEVEAALAMARHVSEIRDVLIAKFVTQLQQKIKEKGILVL
jgi:tetratricopeptide (TPR) repeat protein